MRKLLLFMVMTMATYSSLNSQTVSFSTVLQNQDGKAIRGVHTLQLRLVDKSGIVYTRWNQQKKVLLTNGTFTIDLGDPAQGSSGAFPEELLETHTLEIVENGIVLERINLSSEADEPAQQIPASVQSAKVLVSDIDQASATNNQVLTWVTSEQSWRPRTPQTSGTGGTTGVNTLNAIKGDITIEGVSPLLVNTSSGKVSLSLASNAIPQNTGVPVGTIVAFFGNSNRIPDGWLLCDGKAFTRTDYPQLSDLLDNVGLSPTNTPDLRGQFLRGANLNKDSTSGDPDWSKRSGTGEKIGSVQGDTFQGHWHANQMEYGGTGYIPNTPNSIARDATGKGWDGSYIFIAGDVIENKKERTGKPRISSETRPKNIAIHWIIKAKQ